MNRLKDCYLYGTDEIHGDGFENSAIISILKDGEIKTRENLGIKLGISCNKDNEICLIDPRKKRKGIKQLSCRSAFRLYVLYGATLVLDRNIETFNPPVKNYPNEQEAKIMGVTDLYDEVRHSGDISLDHLQGILYPISMYRLFVHNIFSYESRIVHMYEEIEFIKENFPEIEIKDTFTGKKIDIVKTKKKIDKIKNKVTKEKVKKLSRGSFF